MIVIRKIMEQVYILKDSAGFCANLVLGKEKALLFDMGCGADDMKEAVRTVTDLPLLVIASHGHYDHIGGSYQFDRVYLSEKDKGILEEYDNDILNRWVQEIAGKDDNDKISFGYPDWPQIKPLDFQQFDLGDMLCQVISLSGHTKGSVGVFIPALKLLLSGDALTPIMCLIFFNHGTLGEQYETLKRVEKLDFTDYLTSHHEKAFPKSLIQRMLTCIENSKKGRQYAYQYPYPPYSKGFFYLDSMEEEPIGLVTTEKNSVIKKEKGDSDESGN